MFANQLTVAFMLNTNVLNRYQNYLLIAVALVIPMLPAAVPLLVGGFTFLSILHIYKKREISSISKVSISLIVFYLLQVFWLIGTENMHRGLFVTEVKLALLIVPVSFFGYQVRDIKLLDKILLAFVVGSIGQGMMCLGQSLYHFYVLGESHLVFYTSGFSFMMHPSYLAIYLNLSICILFFNLWRMDIQRKGWFKVLSILAMFFLSLCVFLAAARVGVLMWAVVVLMMISYTFLKLKNKMIPLIGIALVTVFIVLIPSLSPVTSERLGLLVNVLSGETIVDGKSTESTAVRVLVYKTAFELVMQNPWLGQGSGDFRDALIAAYHEHGYEVAATKHYNAHNLFLESWIGLGILGLLSSFAMFFLLIRQAIVSRNKVYLSFVVLFFILSLFESSLSVRLGIMFFAFFAVFFSQFELSKQTALDVEIE